MDSNISSNVDFILQESSNLRKEVLINQLTPKIRGGAVGGSTQNEIDEFWSIRKYLIKRYKFFKLEGVEKNGTSIWIW